MFETARSEALSPQEIDGIECHHAIGAAAVRHDLAPFLQFLEALREVRERYRDRSGNMCRGKLLARAHINDRHVAAANAADQLLVVDRFERATRFEERPRDVLNLGQARLGEMPHVQQERFHLRIRQSIRDVETRLFRLHEACAAEDLKMVRRGGDTLTGLLSKCLDGARAL